MCLCVWRPKDYLSKAVLFFHHEGSKNWTQVGRYGSKHPYPLSSLTSHQGLFKLAYEVFLAWGCESFRKLWSSWKDHVKCEFKFKFKFKVDGCVLDFPPCLLLEIFRRVVSPCLVQWGKWSGIQILLTGLHLILCVTLPLDANFKVGIVRLVYLLLGSCEDQVEGELLSGFTLWPCGERDAPVLTHLTCAQVWHYFSLIFISAKFSLYPL